MKFLLIFSLLLTTFNVYSSDNNSIWKNTYSSFNNQSISLDEVTKESKKKTLIFFWATWCAPCKSELKSIIADQDKLSDYNLIAISIDKVSDAAKAEIFLKKINWPFYSLIDFGGQNFIKSNPFLQVPATYLYNENNQLIETYAEFSIDKLVNSKTVTNEAPTLAKNFAISNLTKLKNNNHKKNDKKFVFNSDNSISFQSDSLSSNVTYQYLNQSNKVEDQLTNIYLQKNFERFQFRIGDNISTLNNGELVYVQNINNQKSPAQMRGFHSKYMSKNWETTLGLGKIHNSLYPTELDLSKDASETRPDEFIYQASLSFYSNSDFQNNSSGYSADFYIAEYKRKADLLLGYNEKYEDKRYGVNFKFKNELGGINQRISYFNSNQKTLNENYIIDSKIYYAFAKVILPISFINSHNPPEKTLTPTLLDSPANSISGKEYIQVIFAPQVKWNNTLDTEFILSKEEIYNKADKAWQNTFGINQGFGEDFRLKFYHQKSFSYSNSSIAYEQALKSEIKFKNSWDQSLQVWLKRRDEFNSNSSSQNLILGTPLIANDFLRKTIPHYIDTLNFDIQYTHQDKYFLNNSGINKKNLFAVSSLIKSDYLSLKMLYGKTPGGLVCVNGICTNVSNEDGFSSELGINYYF